MSISNILRFIDKISTLITPYLSFIFVLIFLVPWILGNLQLHNSDQVLTLIEVFVLSSATLSLLTFTYIAAMSDLHEKVKKSMVKSGEAFFVATVQFIVGLGLFLMVNLIKDHFTNPGDIALSFSMGGVAYVILILIQFIGMYEVASALSKFLKGVFEVYKSFRVLRKPRLYVFLSEKLKS